MMVDISFVPVFFTAYLTFSVNHAFIRRAAVFDLTTLVFDRRLIISISCHFTGRQFILVV